MKNPKLWLYASLLCITAGFAAFYLKQYGCSAHQPQPAERAKLSGAGKQLNAWWWSKAFPNAAHINEKYMAAWNKMQEIKKNTPSQRNHKSISRALANNALNSTGWQPLGPATLGGRILCIAIHPVNRKIIFAGSASGGIWKSTTGGVGLNAWQKVETGLPVLGVSSILIDPANPEIMYAATGEIYRTDKPAMGFNVWKTRGTYSIGILKSTDGGSNWTQVFIKSMADLFGVQKLRFDPTNSSIIYAACTDGLYRSANSGSTWTKVLDKVYVSDVLVNPTNTNQIIAAVGNLTNTDKGIYRTTNGNNASPTWSKITTGLPTSFQGSINFDHYKASNTVYASIGIADVPNPTTNNPRPDELFRSTDFGVNWSAITNSWHGQFQYWFAHAAAVDPNNINRIFVAGVDKHRLDISGNTVNRTDVGSAGATMNTDIAPGGQEGSGGYVHDDVHDIEYVPGRSDSMYIICDGGIFLTTNANATNAANVTFQSCNSGLQTAQFFGPVGQSQTDANLFLGGLQDNNTVVYNGVTGRWKRMIGGDGGPSAIKPDDDNIILSSRDARAVYKSIDRAGSYPSYVATGWGGAADSRTGFMAPLAFSKSNPNIAYLASDNLHRSSNAGSTWSGSAYSTATKFIEQRNKTAVALAVSPTNENKVYVSTSPFAQYDNNVDEVYVNGNPNFFKTTNANLATPTYTNIMTGLPNRFVMDIAIHPTDDNTLWVVMGGYGASHVYKSTNGGSTWTDIDRGNLPDVPTNAVMLDPNNSNVIYVGNDLGIFVSADGGTNWMDYNSGLWDATLVMDLVPVPGGKIRAATHGKGVFENALLDLTTLPVTFVSFSGAKQGNDNVLQWMVSQEHDLSHYQLERSADGIHFQKIADIKAKATASETLYAFADKNALNSFYYRVKSIDLDGKYQHTQVIFIKRDVQNQMSVIGNPFYSDIHLRFQLNRGGHLQIHLYDAKGALLKRQSFTASAGQTDLTIRGLSHLPQGIYQVEAILNQQRWVQKVIKQ